MRNGSLSMMVLGRRGVIVMFQDGAGKKVQRPSCITNGLNSDFENSSRLK